MSNPFEPPLLKPDSPEICKVVFQPSGQSGKVKAGLSLLDAARSLGVGIESICGGAGTCGKCQVIIEEGRFAKYDLTSSADHVSSADQDERSICARRGLSNGVRLSCLAHVKGDLLVTVPEEAQANRQVVRKAATERVIQVDPIIRMALLTLDPPILGDRSDQERILALLESRFGLKAPTFELTALKSLPAALREGHGEVSLTIWNDQAVIRVQAGLHDTPLGLAVDIGSTSLAAYL
ncbi:MAG TPA: ferredoxin, partial [Anaerolineaceae bacterium]|nr:ferredoxin [Anaerolineaceae bacterium]